MEDTKTNGRLCYSVPELAEKLGVSKPTAYSLVNRSDFPKIRIGRRLICPSLAVDVWLQNHLGEELEVG